MAGSVLFSAWKVVHAKFVKPVDNALDSFSLMMLQWLLGVYNIWDVLRICSGVCISAVKYLATVVQHPSVLWTSDASGDSPTDEADKTEADAEGDDELQCEGNADTTAATSAEEADVNSSDGDDNDEDDNGGVCVELAASQQEQQQLQQSVTPSGDGGVEPQQLRQRAAATS